MKMKYILLAVAIFIVAIFALSALPGCEFGQRLHRAQEAFRAANPNAGMIPVDEDGDGTIDFLGVDADGDHKVDVDPAGKLVEVPDSRASYSAAGAVDTGVADFLPLVAAIIGIPGVGLLGKWWGKQKPVKQFTTLVGAFENAKRTGAPEGMIMVSKEALQLYLSARPELDPIIEQIRTDVKKKKTS